MSKYANIPEMPSWFMDENFVFERVMSSKKASIYKLFDMAGDLRYIDVFALEGLEFEQTRTDEHIYYPTFEAFAESPKAESYDIFGGDDERVFMNVALLIFRELSGEHLDPRRHII